jgi:tRNA A37 N6-isopentenylltransferase MiaA
MDQDYKSVVERLALQLIDIETSLDAKSQDINAILISLIDQGIITSEQYTERQQRWWKQEEERFFSLADKRQ